MDALSYLALGHIFTANMTGNTVLLGLALMSLYARARASWTGALRYGFVLAISLAAIHSGLLDVVTALLAAGLWLVEGLGAVKPCDSDTRASKPEAPARA